MIKYFYKNGGKGRYNMTEFVLMFVGLATVATAVIGHRITVALISAAVSLSFGAVLVMNTAGVDFHPNVKYNLYASLFMVLVVCLCVAMKNVVMKVMVCVLFVWMICLYWFYIVPDYTDYTVDGVDYVCEYSKRDTEGEAEVRYHKKINGFIMEKKCDYSEIYESFSDWEKILEDENAACTVNRVVRY